MDIVLLDDAKASRSFDQDVHSAIGKTIEQADDTRRASDVIKIVVCAPYKTKFGVVVETFTDHLFVSLFKDVQGNTPVRQQHHVEGKEGKFHWVRRRVFDCCL